MSELEVTRVMSDLRGLYERGKLSDEQIARLDAIGFNWERKKRIKPTLAERCSGREHAGSLVEVFKVSRGMAM